MSRLFRLLAVPATLLVLIAQILFAAEPRPPVAEPFVRPEFARQMRELRPAILSAASRHNDPSLSGMTDVAFAEVVALVLYNEHAGWLEDALPPVRALTPIYQSAQIDLNRAGADFTVWPSNLRPSVALEILRQEVPVPGGVVRIPLRVAGSRVAPESFRSRRDLYAALTGEITRPEMAVEYLAANLARGVARARHERVPVTWRALAAWHNQGIVAPEDVAANPTARDYLRRTEAYLPVARALIANERTRR